MWLSMSYVPYTDIIVVFIGYTMDMSDDDFLVSTSPSMSSTWIDVKSTRTVGLWEAFIYRHRVLLHHSHGLPYMIPPYPYPYYTYTSTSYMNSLALTWSKYGPRRPPKGQSASHYCVHGSTFCRTPNRDQKRPLLWREHRHTSKIVTNMVVVSSTVTL